MMYCGGAEMCHSRRGGTSLPAIEQVLVFIDDSDFLPGDSRFANEADGEVHTVNASPDDDPVVFHGFTFC